MAEKGIIVDDAASGESVACRDAIQQDDDSNNRIIQLVDKASRPIVYQRSTPLRSGVTTSDSFDIDPLPAGIAAALLDVSDAESCIIWCMLTLGTGVSSDFRLHICPIVVSEDATPVAVTLLPPIRMLPVYPKGEGESSEVYTDRLLIARGTELTMARSFPTYGAKQLGFHITLVYGTYVSVDFFAEPASCMGRESGIDDDIVSREWGESYAGA